MSAGYKVRYDPAALAALEETVAYIQEQSGPNRAAAWLGGMRAGIQDLESLPRAFPAVSLRKGKPVHSKLVISHRVYYFVDDPTRTVYIIDVVHTAHESKLARYRDGPD